MATISNPFVMEVPRKLTDEELVNAIRQDIIGELDYPRVRRPRPGDG